jgi:L-asparagine transporter-like permease
LAIDDDSFSGITQRESGLRRALSARKLSMIALGGAVGTGLFFRTGFAIGLAGPAVILSYMLAAFIALLLVGCLTEMTIAHPTSGSFGAYAEYYIGPLAGFLVRYSYWVGNVLAVGTEVAAIALYLQHWLPASPGWLWGATFSVLLVVMNYMSVGLFGTIEYWLSALKLTAIVLFILIVGHSVFGSAHNFDAGLHNYVSHGGLLPKGWWGAWVAVVVALFGFIGVEMVAVAAGEAQQPEVAVKRAFTSTILRLIVFYLTTLVLMLAVVPWTVLSASRAPFVLVLDELEASIAADLMRFVILIAALSAMNGQLYISTRMMFGLARANWAPSRLGVLNERGVPVSALVISSGGIVLATVLSIIAPDSAYIVMVAISIFGAIFSWIMIFVTHYFYRRSRRHRGPAAEFQMYGFPVLTVTGMVLLLAILVSTWFTAPFRLTLIFGLPFLICLTIIYHIWYRERV